MKFSGVSPNLLSRSVTLPQSSNVVNPGKMLIPDVNESFQDTTQNLRRRRLLGVEDR